MNDKAIEAAARALVRQYEIEDGFSEEQAEQHSKGEMWKNFRKAAECAIAAYEQALWRPIEEVPSADVDFLLAHRGWPNNYWEFEVGFYRSSKGGWINGRATHYRPLPPPPVTP